jgi:hypothetical protein
LRRAVGAFGELATHCQRRYLAAARGSNGGLDPSLALDAGRDSSNTEPWPTVLWT